MVVQKTWILAVLLLSPTLGVPEEERGGIGCDIDLEGRFFTPLVECEGVPWCACVKTMLSSRRGGEAVAILQRQVYPIGSALFDVQFLSVDSAVASAT